MFKKNNCFLFGETLYYIIWRPTSFRLTVSLQNKYEIKNGKSNKTRVSFRGKNNEREINGGI